MNKRLLAVPALGALLAFGAVGCGDDNSKQLESWAANVCGAAKDPIAQAQTALADTGQVKTGEAPADLQKRLSADIGRLAKTNQEIAAAIDSAGAPKVDEGGNLQKDTVSELNKAADLYLDVQKKLDALPNDEQAKFADGLRSVADQVQKLASLSTQAQAKLQRGDLGAAMAKQEGCKPGSAAAAPTAGASGTPTAGGSTGTPAPGATDGATDGASPAGSQAATDPAATSAPPAPAASSPAPSAS
ncbi:small secreted protein [Kitasatospora sp. NPDC005751]|uniref:small secreted protein n=1 Tax=Kitasatospora sp. NPDC005751 TaxID=3157064 RepID=UPI0033E346ED